MNRCGDGATSTWMAQHNINSVAPLVMVHRELVIPALDKMWSLRSCLLVLGLTLLGILKEAGATSTYHNQFALYIPHGKVAAERLASKHGFVNLGEIGSLDNYFLFEHPRLQRRSTEKSADHTSMLLSEPEVVWAEQMVEKRRVKRFDRPVILTNSDMMRPLWDPLFDESIDEAEQVSRIKRQGVASFISDPMFNSQWHLNRGARGGFDMNVKPAWNRGFSGKGVVVTILDDGIQHNHPDLRDNYDPLASTDINGNDNDPMPQDNGDNKHGTRCAGEVAASANNGYCGVGIAYNASIGGVWSNRVPKCEFVSETWRAICYATSDTIRIHSSLLKSGV